ncbi:SCO family protein [Wenzhouxiangella sp. AB-CW3]|uniref:SCO family protein n=1 Tax=Wenzhouxiangella sp. AB-CW3 TaxID=2771012 RepID=UPI00168ADD91|nr:SCO family protein [Wenzhouxiangella sp. AB-CW3]QOC23424.1 SCO family protein [Wenzhouxiangella sp. AB-CW3]
MNQMPGFRTQNGRIFIIIAIAVAAIAGGIVVSSNLMQRTLDLREARLFPQARHVDEFQLETAAGESFTRSDLEGRWTLLFAGFTNCPDICPDTLAVLAQSMRDLDMMRQETLPQVVFLSVDPERDQGEHLAEYVRWFHDDFIGVTGDLEEIDRFTRQLGLVYFHEEADEETGFYNVDHSASILIIDPEGRLYGRFGPAVTSEDVTADVFALTR